MSVDIDGDGKPDHVEYRKLGTNRYNLRVTTASGTVAETFKTRGGDTSWIGAGDMDGEPGAELIVGAGGEEESVLFDVVGWRPGSLVQIPAPKQPSGTGWGVYGVGNSWSGYHFFRRNGRQYVEAADLHSEDASSSGPVTGTVIRSVWDAGWNLVSTKHVSMTATEAAKFSRFRGVHITR